MCKADPLTAGPLFQARGKVVTEVISVGFAIRGFVRQTLWSAQRLGLISYEEGPGVFTRIFSFSGTADNVNRVLRMLKALDAE